MFVHESGETLSGGKLHVPATKQDAQGYGSALTYARRYSLMAATGIAPEDDDGNAASKKPMKPLDAASACKTLSEAGSMEDLKVIYAKAFKSFQGDAEALKAIDAAKDKRKGELLEIA